VRKSASRAPPEPTAADSPSPVRKSTSRAPPEPTAADSPQPSPLGVDSAPTEPSMTASDLLNEIQRQLKSLGDRWEAVLRDTES
jgi:hypothetical protein